jgi:hypothetical protein
MRGVGSESIDGASVAPGVLTFAIRLSGPAFGVEVYWTDVYWADVRRTVHTGPPDGGLGTGASASG